MRLKPIIVPNKKEPHGLWAIQYNGESVSTFSQLLGKSGLWFDTSYLQQFFAENESDLIGYQWGKQYPKGVSIAVASLDTVQFALQLNKELLQVAKQSIDGEKPDFDEFFKNYDNSQLGLRELNFSKRQHPPVSGWLRLYAISICPTCYIITGGAIKLIESMKRKHLELEDRKLKQVQAWLKYNNVSDFDSFKDFVNNE